MECKQPWLNKDETMKSEAEIKESCKGWSPSTWESYLQTLEVEQKEAIMKNPRDVEEYSQEEHDKYMDILGSSRAFPTLEKKLLESMESLTLKQKIVLHRLFWEKMGVRALAREMNVAASSLILMRDRALKQVGSLLIKSILPMPDKAPKKEDRFLERSIG